MRERKYVKFRCDMYADTKFKIIDTKPERDLIHYVWMAIVILAGKVNLEGELYLSKNIPYTLETLAIEFNRDIGLVKLALDVLVELEMVEVSEKNIYKVKNFAKHQNIKSKKKIDTEEEQIDTNKQEVKANERVEKQIYYIKDNEIKDKTKENEKYSIKNKNESNLEATHKNNDSNKGNIMTEANNSNENSPIFLEKEKRKKISKKRKEDNSISVTDGKNEEKEMMAWSESERPLGEGETLIKKWSFSG